MSLDQSSMYLYFQKPNMDSIEPDKKQLCDIFINVIT
jgi:hypothetical protein